MARDPGFKVQGLTQVVRALDQFGVEVEDLKDAFSSIAAEGAQVAAQYAPHVSGRLASDVRGNRAKSKAVVTAGRASVPYAGPINYGWPARSITGAGFMQKASDVMEPVAIVRLEAEINHIIRVKGLSQ
jgi:hypothetical protein